MWDPKVYLFFFHPIANSTLSNLVSSFLIFSLFSAFTAVVLHFQSRINMSDADTSCWVPCSKQQITSNPEMRAETRLLRLFPVAHTFTDFFLNILAMISLRFESGGQRHEESRVLSLRAIGEPPAFPQCLQGKVTCTVNSQLESAVIFTYSFVHSKFFLLFPLLGCIPL